MLIHFLIQPQTFTNFYPKIVDTLKLIYMNFSSLYGTQWVAISIQFDGVRCAELTILQNDNAFVISHSKKYFYFNTRVIWKFSCENSEMVLI